MIRGLRLLLIVAALLPSTAFGHDFYSRTCCGGEDCHPIASCADIQSEKGGGVTWGGYHFERNQVQPSQDGMCHVCIHDTHGALGNKPICIYTQQGS